MNRNTLQNINVGVDTGKSQLDIYIRPLDVYFTVSNTDEGISDAIKIIKKHKPQRVVIEATGRLEMPFILACDKAKLPYVIANPLRIKRFAEAIGQRAKNDRLDAELIAHYAERVQPELTKLKSENIRLMSDLVTRRNQLLTMQTMERNRLQILPKNISSTITPILTALKNQLEKVEAKITKLIESCPEYQAKNTILQSMPGVTHRPALFRRLSTRVSLCNTCPCIVEDRRRRLREWRFVSRRTSSSVLVSLPLSP